MGSVLVLLYLSYPHFTEADNSAPPVAVAETAQTITIDNGTIIVEFSRAKGQITAIRYRHGGEITEMANTMYTSYSAGPADVPAAKPATPEAADGDSAKSKEAAPRPGAVTAPRAALRVARKDPDAAEVVMEFGPTPSYPFHTETHYVIPHGASGFYAYQIYKHAADQPAAFLGEARFVIKGKPGTELYTNHVVDADRMGPFPASPVVRKVMDASFLHEDGTIYTKYNNSAFMADHYVHGMAGHGLGIWMVNATNEYVNGGPVKQELTVHEDNTLLNMLEGAHFGGGVLRVEAGEDWTKFYGPFFVYVNSGPSIEALYKDALRQDDEERAKWPYAWVNRDSEYPVRRGTVSGTLRLSDSKSAEGAWVILAAPGGDWTQQGKGYEFWSQAGKDGAFQIPKVRPGSYTLYAYGADQFDQFQKDNITVESGKTTDLKDVTWQTITHGRRLWQIGKPDRSTREFREGDNVRHWANYMRYQADFPDDVTYVIGKSREERDWNFAQWTWYAKKPHWTIQFDLPAKISGKATLTLGFASSNPVQGSHTNLQVGVNGTPVDVLQLPKSGAAAYRSGGQDSLYQVRYITFDAALLKPGVNEITLGHKDAEPFPTPEIQMHGQVGEVMYDALRLEIQETK